MLITYADIIKQNNSIPTFRHWILKQDSLYLDYEQWFEDVICTCKYFDAVVYTASFSHTEKCRKLICAKLISEVPKNVKLKLAGNVHTKLYIVTHFGWKEKSFWIGSGNLCSSNFWHNIMIRVDDKENQKTLALYFKNLWNLAS